MAQASNAPAREPSMEEILASIRRIIEDSDTARRSADDLQDDTAAEAMPAEAEGHSDFREEPATPEVEAFRSEFTEAEPVEVTPAAPETMGSLMRGNGAHPTNGFDRHHPASTAHEEEEVQPEPAYPAAVQAREEAPSRDDGSNSRGAIISDFAGRQVAAAFEELSEAFSASRKRSYDEIAEEIMRPMLQDWLDNNLPLLVERLVREEIERVARGGVR
jgi:uncharacterized protein